MESMKGVCGIYRLTNTVNGKVYVGSSLDIRGRAYKHLSQLRRGIHNNAHLQAAFNLAGEAAFAFEVLEECTKETLLAREQHYLDTLQPDYNICQVAGNTLGYVHGDEAKAKMTRANMGNQRWVGRSHTEETRQKLSLIASQRPVDYERLARMAEGNKGNKHTAGRKLDPAHKAKVSAGLFKAWEGGRSKEAAAERLRARWADPEWKAQQLAKIAAGRVAKRAARGLE